MANRYKSESRNTSNIVAIASLATLIVLIGGYFFFAWWMRPPAVSFDNLKYIQLLRTAVSSQRLDYVNKVNEAIEIRKSDGQMSDSEWNHFQSIIQTARTGDWSSADKACMSFELAQLSRNRD